MSINNLPFELKQRDQWVGSDNKGAPINPSTGRFASSNKPNTWGSFAEACRCGTQHIAFIFSESDPYTVIDLDTYDVPQHASVHARIVQTLDSYTEHSKSGAGTHIIVRGKLPRSVKNASFGVEMYSVSKAMTLTGDVYGSEIIQERQEQLDALFEEFATTVDADFIESHAKETCTDDVLIEKIRDSGQAKKFEALYSKQKDYLVKHYNKSLNKFDHSQADSALLTVLGHWTKSDEQVVRVFKTSKLYRPEKGKLECGTDYIKRTLAKARGFSARKAQEEIEEVLQVSKNLKIHAEKASEPATQKARKETKIPGLVGELQEYFYSRAVRPVYEVSLAAALALMAGIAGRQFQISGSGLNLYLMIIGQTGVGKEDGARGISAIIAALKNMSISVDDIIGPSDFASGTGMLNAFDGYPCFVSIVGEIGVRLQEISKQNASDANQSLKRTLLSLYSKSGKDQFESGKVYAKKKDNLAGIHAPCPTILGDSTPETFFGALSEHEIATGLIPRFSMLEYTGRRPRRNKTTANMPPDTQLIRKIAKLVRKVEKMNNNQAFQDIVFDNKGLKLLDDFDAWCDEKMDDGDEVDKQLWNRAHLKALRVAGLLAVGNLESNETPRVTVREAKWAIDFVKQDVEILAHRFANGTIGQGEQVQEAIIKEVITKAIQKNRCTKLLTRTMLDHKCISHAYIREKLRKQTAFKTSKHGTAKAIKNALADLVEAEILVKLDNEESHAKFETKSALYAPGRNW